MNADPRSSDDAMMINRLENKGISSRKTDPILIYGLHMVSINAGVQDISTHLPSTNMDALSVDSPTSFS